MNTKPCPFCGHEKIVPTDEGMMCTKCEARGPWPYFNHNMGFKTQTNWEEEERKQMTQDWNKRTQ